MKRFLKRQFKYLALPLFLVVVILIVFLQFISGKNINSLIEGNTTLLNDLRIQTDFKKLESDIVILESDIRGAAIRGDKVYLQNVEKLVLMIRNEINDIKKKVTDKNTIGSIHDLDNLVEEKIKFSYMTLGTLRNQGKEAAQKLIRTNRGQNIRDSIVNAIRSLENKRQSEMALIIGTMDESGRRVRSWGLFLAIIGGSLCMLAFWHFVSQGQYQEKLINVLDTSEKKVKEAAAVKEQFMANMSHEIRTPMNAMLGFTNLLQKTTLDSNQKQYVRNIQSSSENLLAIVNDILDLSKIEAGMMRIEYVPFSLRGLMHSVETMFGEKTQQKGLYLNVQVDENIPDTLNGDAVRLTQILVNLLSNSVKFTMKGGIDINVKALNQNHTIRVQFSLKDTGIGIAESKQKAVFERFQQAEAETTRRYGGTGLGLSIVKQLVELQNGFLDIKSEEGVGTEFIFEIPYEISTEIIDSKKTDYFPVNQLSPSVKILVAEDNQMNQQLMKHLLQSWKLDFDIANNGKEVLEALQKVHYDLILMDIQMPEMDGYKATQKIREELKSKISIIAMTAHAMAGEREKCISYGMNDYISKPIREADLYRLISKYISEDKDKTIENGTVIKLDYLKELSRGNKDFEKEIINQFIKQVPEEIALLGEAIEHKDFSTIRSLAHSMKSSISYMGLTYELEPILEEMESQADNGVDISTIQACFNSVQFTCSKAINEAEIILQNYQE